MSTAFAAIMLAVANLVMGTNVFAQSRMQDGTATASDAQLLLREGRPWWYTSTVSPQPVELRRRAPNVAERAVIERAQTIMASPELRAFALVDGDTVVYQQFKAPANEEAVFFGFSMGKTVTAMGVGQAICAGKLQYDTRASELVPQLKGKPLGMATVRDLLRMASGSRDGNPDSTIWSVEQARAWVQGNLNLVDLISDDRVAMAQKGVFDDIKPGEVMSYKATDPLLLGVMTSQATGMPWSQWLQQSVLNPMGAAHAGLYVQDRQRNGLADTGMRLRMQDWIRFALWIKRSSKEQGCFGDFVRDAMRTQIKNGSSPADRWVGKNFAGYGYFTWTENTAAPNTVWAVGWGGQRIGWSTDPSNHRMIIKFSNVENRASEVSEVARDWMLINK
jgi:CubicO group peptidase (beta-lactamase class C family)